jgi:hypothetical protein
MQTRKPCKWRQSLPACSWPEIYPSSWIGAGENKDKSREQPLPGSDSSINSRPNTSLKSNLSNRHEQLASFFCVPTEQRQNDCEQYMGKDATTSSLSAV